MNPESVYAKTEKGKQEIATRRHGLPQPLRFALILVDGRSTLAQLMDRGAGLPNLRESLQMLLDMGFIEGERGTTRPAPALSPSMAAPGGWHPAAASAKRELIDLAHGLLRDQAGKVVRKLEDCDDSAVALGAALEACYKLIRLAIDERRAEQFLRAGKDILSRR
jgi:hypothetical protein